MNPATEQQLRARRRRWRQRPQRQTRPQRPRPHDNRRTLDSSRSMARHSLPYPTVPASAPTSPAVLRSKSNPPATPQRVTHRSQHRQLSSSPYTPATVYSTPYTPLSLRSFSSSTGSSLATPNSAASNRRLSFSNISPENSFRARNKKSVADATHNWRDRANENGIRVTPGEDSQFADDEGQYIQPVHCSVDTSADVRHMTS